MNSKATRKDFIPFSLDAVNFLSADVRGAVGPYLNVFLVTQQHWSQSEVGLVTTISGLLGIVVQTPIGAAIDETRAKRGVVVLALTVLAVMAVVIFALPTFWPVAVANSLMAVAGDVFGPAVASLTWACSHENSWRSGWDETRPSTVPAMSQSRWLRARSDMHSRSAPFSCWCPSSPC